MTMYKYKAAVAIRAAGKYCVHIPKELVATKKLNVGESVAVILKKVKT